MTISNTLPEPVSDLNAQLALLKKKNHPRVAVFLSRHDDVNKLSLPRGARVTAREEGTLITFDRDLARWFASAPEITDGDLAKILGYPQSKDQLFCADNDVRVVQVQDSHDRVIYEAAASPDALDKTIETAQTHGRRVIVTSLLSALKRRMKTA